VNLRLVVALLLPLCLFRAVAAPIPDEPFWQDVAVRIRHAPELTNAVFKKLCVDKENVVYVLTDKGVARVFDDTLALDRSFRPLAGKVPLDITTSPEGDLYYLFEERWLSNGRNGQPGGQLPAGKFTEFTVIATNMLRFEGPRNSGRISLYSPQVPLAPEPARLEIFDRGLRDELPKHFLIQEDHLPPEKFPIWTVDLHIWMPDRDHYPHWPYPKATTLAQRNGLIFVGTTNGYFGFGRNDNHYDPTKLPVPLQTNLPANHVTKLVAVEGGLWVGTTRGAFFERDGTNSRYATPSAPGIEPPRFRYYAGKRWLRDDHVVDLATDRDGHLWVLTQTGLNKIEFRQTTLAAKADWFHRKIRSRNMRYGFTAERRLRVPGDITTSEMIDTDNDGGWTSYYLGSLAARYAVTREEETRRQAWESFGALERLQSIHTHTGFPARTFERRGFKFSDTDRWRDAPDPGWEWKGHTSSDEMQAQGFAHAVMWELVATNATERARVATNWVAVIDHILRHNLYLVDVDGEPTLWGRWHPDYVNWFPPSIHDRRLNSAEITAGLQLAYRMTGNEAYRARAYELFEKHGYLTNILSSMQLIAPTKGYVFRENDMGNEWNHSDDELAFFNYWVLVRFAFSDGLRAKYLAAVADHWHFEQLERYPIWNFLYAACGAKEFDAAGAVWTLRGTPLDTIAWRMSNSHRQDITKLEPNFMGRELKELLPPGERLIARINTQPFILDHGDDTTDFPGDEFLLGYWLGRYVGAIGEAK
jgi:hypothetical protein